VRYAAIALLALLISAPAVAIGTPDALSMAKRALRLAKEPPKVKQIYTTVAESENAEVRRIRVRCPRGMVAAAISPELPSLYESVQGRVAFAVLPQQQQGAGFGPGPDGITVTCIEGRLIRP
jgi:hypothetical protein